MKRIEPKLAVKAAERDIVIGWATGAALSLAAFYGFTIAVRWIFGGHLLPPVSFGALLVGNGLYRGIRGTESLASLPAVERSHVR